MVSMWENVIQKMKKYLLLVSILFFVVIGSHLIYLYLYEGAQETPIQWGTISEGIIGSFPHLNPLIPSTDYNKYINSILYRSLLSYNIEEWKLESDLASCDISNLVYIECYLENNISWSNGEPITPDDIIATLNIIEKSGINPGIGTLLETSTIEKGNGKIVFNNEKKDINFLNILLQPILPKNTVESLSQEALDGNFSPIDGIYSGRYILSSVSQDETVGITKMTLSKNPNFFQNDTFIESIIFNVFRDNTHFLKHKNSVNIFNDKENIVWNSIPRLKSFPYTLPQFVWMFLNQEAIDSAALREAILSSINREIIVEEIGETRSEIALNPFLSEELMDGSYDGDIAKIIQDAGYFSKIDLIENTLAVKTQEETQKMSQEAPIRKIGKTQEDIQVIVSPTKKKYNFISEDNVLLRGVVPDGITAVYINDYKLQGYSEWDTVFYYRLLESFDNIVEWENSYKVYFEGADGNREFKEEVVYIYYTDTEKLTEIQNWFFAEGQENTQAAGTIENTSEIENLNVTLDESSLQNLDERFYYTPDGDAFKIKIVYVNSDKNLEISALSVKQQIEKLWIFVELVTMSLEEITRWLRDDSLEYDGILIGLNLGYFDSNIFPYFHSSQVQNGYNFSNFKQLGLDILLEELKSNNLTNTKKAELEIKVLDILKKASTVKVLYSPKISLLVDQGLQGFSLPWFIPDEIHRFDPLINTYLTQKKIISTDKKWFLDFWRFVITSFL